MDNERQHRWYAFIWFLLRPVATALSRVFFNFRAELNDIQGPYLLVSNHLTDWDGIILGSVFKSQMYFVTTEDILRRGFVSKLITGLFGFIGRQKGGNAAGTVKSILRALKNGRNVALFPEGNRSWDGLTGPIPPATGKLARTSGATLVTYRLSGGYFSSPRWAGGSMRKGKMSGKIVGIYSPEQLRAMSADEVNERIKADVYEDAYAGQQKEEISFRGKKLAEHLENLLFICPECGKTGSLHSEDNSFRCAKCGAEAEYLSTGFLKGSFRFSRITDWARWQNTRLDEIIACNDSSPLFTDDSMDLYQVITGKSRTRSGSGVMKLYKDRLELPGDMKVPFSEIRGMAVRGASRMFLGLKDGRNFELMSDKVRCTSKYITACRKMGVIDYGV